MLNLNGYEQTAEIHHGSHSLVFRAIRKLDNARVVIKSHAKAYPTISDITKLRHEFELTKNLGLECIPEYYALEKHENGLALVMQDTGGLSLARHLEGRRIPIEEFLATAIQLASALECVHRAGIIHKDLTQHNMLVSPDDETIRIIDFGLATSLNSERQKITAARVLDGTLTHVSPEQTGRINRVIDQRSDLYSLGVTLYEILVGHPPYSSADPLELIFCHLARIAEPPNQVDARIPAVVSDIVMRLLAKTPEDRYQTAAGLKADLERCLAHVEGKMESFAPFSRDGIDRFQIPQRLYGRSAELSVLLETFDRVCAGNIELLLVSGYSGIGKSSLVHELQRSILGKRGNFAAGKFDQYKRDIPYASFVQAMRDLVRHVLAEEEASVRRWADQLRGALGEAAKVIVDVIPEVELIIGPQPEPPQLTGAAAQRRFNDVLLRFVATFASPNHPLVIFLDDLQWADPETLSLLQLFTTDPTMRSVLLIGAYRDNEVNAYHPLSVVIAQARSAGARIREVVLQPLSSQDLSRLIADTVHQTIEQVAEVSSIIESKTHGNPFFVNQLLLSLHEDSLIRFDPVASAWTWDCAAIRARALSENVVDLMGQRIRSLTPETQQTLMLAACIGNTFDLRTLAIVRGSSLKATAIALWPALKETFVLPANDSYRVPHVWDLESEVDERALRVAEGIRYRFLHDRVQQAAYSLIERERLATVHLQIGRVWLERSTARELDEDLFEIVNHYNAGRDLLTDSGERRTLAGLNVRAAIKAKRNSAFQAALQYATLASTYLSAKSWEADYELTLACYLELGDASFLNGRYREALEVLERAEPHARSVLDRCKLCELKIVVYKMLNDLSAAFESGASILRALGINLERYPNEAELRAELAATQAAIGDRSIDDLGNQPEMTDPSQIAACRILQEIWPVGFFLGSLGMHVAAMRIVQLSARHGNARTSVFGYMVYGFALLFFFGNVEDGHSMGLLSLKLHERFQTREIETKILDMWGGLIQHYKEHIREGKATLLRGFTRGLEIGDYQWAGYCAMNYTHLVVLGDATLEDAIAHVDRVLPILRKYDQNMTNTQLIAREGVATLVEGKDDPTSLVGAWCDEQQMARIAAETKDSYILFVIWFYKLLTATVFDRTDVIIEAQARAEETIGGSAGIWINPVFYYLQALGLLQVHDRVGAEDQAKHLGIVRRNHVKISTWMHHAPENFTHMHALLEAELARVEKRYDVAIRFYEEAIWAARANGFLHDQALAAERASNFYRSLGSNTAADGYMREARYWYQVWGADAKVTQIDQDYPRIHSAQYPGSDRPSSGDLDAFSVVKVSQALSGELVLEDLATALMRTLIEGAGAERAFLFLVRPDGKLVIEASTLPIEILAVPCPLEECSRVPAHIVNYVARARSAVLLDDASTSPQFLGDPYVVSVRPKSVLCIPVVRLGNLSGVVYLENNHMTGAFTSHRVRVVEMLAAQAAVSLENARLYDELEQRVQIRTKELREAQEKMTDLALQAGRAEVVVNIIHNVGNILNGMTIASSTLEDALRSLAGPDLHRVADLVLAHKDDLPNFLLEGPGKLIPSYLKTMAESDDAVRNDCLEDVARIRLGLDRIIETIEDQRGFVAASSRLVRQVVIPTELDLALRLFERPLEQHLVTVRRHYAYGRPVPIEVHKLRQILSNLIANAVHALEESGADRSLEVSVRPRDETSIEIEIADTGVGIAPDALVRIFEQGFTTKARGHGIGLHYCSNTAKEMGGNLLVSSAGHGKGASFKLVLPLSGPPTVKK